MATTNNIHLDLGFRVNIAVADPADTGACQTIAWYEYSYWISPLNISFQGLKCLQDIYLNCMDHIPNILSIQRKLVTHGHDGALASIPNALAWLGRSDPGPFQEVYPSFFCIIICFKFEESHVVKPLHKNWQDQANSYSTRPFLTITFIGLVSPMKLSLGGLEIPLQKNNYMLTDDKHGAFQYCTQLRAGLWVSQISQPSTE